MRCASQRGRRRHQVSTFPTKIGKFLPDSELQAKSGIQNQKSKQQLLVVHCAATFNLSWF
jgi:hypothetical protein